MSFGIGSFFKGTSYTQDNRYKDKNKKLIQNSSFPTELEIKVDFKKVDIEVIKGWIRRKIPSLMGFDDDIVVNFAISELEQSNLPAPFDPKEMQMHLTGFLEEKAPLFMVELWMLLNEAQKSPNGIVNKSSANETN